MTPGAGASAIPTVRRSAGEVARRPRGAGSDYDRLRGGLSTIAAVAATTGELLGDRTIDVGERGFAAVVNWARGANARQLLGRAGDVWGAESGTDRLVVALSRHARTSSSGP
jgi:hypothetical protein